MGSLDKKAQMDGGRRTMEMPAVIPREHGAWGILIFSVALGIGVSGQLGIRILLFCVAALALFLARHPLTLLVKGGSVRRIVLWEAVYVLAAAAASIPLFVIYRLWWLLAFGAGFAVYLAAYVLVAVGRKQRTARGEMLGISGLALAAPAAFYVSGGVWQPSSLYLWLLSFLYHASSVFYVKLKVKHRTLPGPSMSFARRWQLGRDLLFYMTVLVVAVMGLGLTGQAPALAIAAYLPLIGKSVWSVFLPTKIGSVRRLGWTEVVHGLVYTGLLIAVYRLAA